ncbi:Uncharacterised protein [uncultured archaeon]|nr:Uncharacterised protein [uncultured archaeon]
MESFRMKLTKTAAALALASGLTFSACAGPQPLAEPHRQASVSVHSAAVKGINLSSHEAADKFQRKFIDDFLKDFDKRKFNKPFSSQNKGGHSTVTAEYFYTGKNKQVMSDDMMTGRKVMVDYVFPANSDVAKVMIMFEEPVRFNSAWGTACELYNRQFVMHGADDPYFRPERDTKIGFTDNVETILFLITKKRKR